MKALMILSAIAMSTTLAVPAMAAAETNASGQLVAKVSYSDLNLATAAGQAQLDRRVRAAIRQVCQQPDTRDLRASMDYRQCADQSRTAAKKTIQLALNAQGKKVRRA